MVIQNKLYISSYYVSTKGMEIRALRKIVRRLYLSRFPAVKFDAFLLVC